MQVYHLKTCDTCRKALRALVEAGMEPHAVDVRADGVGADVLHRIHARHGEAMLNTRSTTWRGLTEDDRARARTTDGLIALITDHPTLLKRPVIMVGDDIHLGWTPAVRTALLDC